jgi:ABC-2 type transport system permease protein
MSSLWNSKYLLLVRRELWEHKSLWMAPLIVAGLLIVLPMFGNSRIGTSGNFSSGAERDVVAALFGQATMFSVALTLGGIACLALFAYLLDCLYAERKDRSILFWKSLPVSDTATVLAKLVLAAALVPLLVLLLSVLVQLLVMGALYLRFENARAVIGAASVTGSLQLVPKVATVWLYGVLWYAPFMTWLMLSSVLARRIPLMYAMTPPLVLVLLEWQLFDTGRVLRFLGERLAPWIRSDWAWDYNPERGLLPGMGSPDWHVVFLNSSLWLGLAAAAVMVYMVIRLRRHRDDT